MWLSSIPLCRYSTICLSIRLLMDILGCWHSLAMTNHAAVSIREWFFVWLYVFVSLG